MNTSGLERVSISVADLDAALKYYRDYAGLAVQADEQLGKEELGVICKLAAGASARAVTLKNETQSTLVELVEFKPSGNPIRHKVADYDIGLYDIAFSIEGEGNLYKDLSRQGYRFVAPPYSYNPFGNKVREAILAFPDNMHIAHLERIPDPVVEKPVKFLRMADCAQIIPSMDEAVNFYCGTLGLDLQMRMDLAPGLVDTVLGLPRDTQIVMAFINRKDSAAVACEFMEIRAPKGSVGEVAKPPNLGVYQITFKVDNLGEALDKVSAAGYGVFAGPTVIERKLWGRVKMTVVNGPGGTLVGLYQK
jgi:catechol 2,3-dioxygenase-like lactoylglutathione lyase family enzyme